ncbi:hypothetical protein [Hyalangium versicolor]|uniref:hypothetical protein n=1 Tax=Hyalangium versicolor TaxID=2861190 RepID=UPI001CCD1F12|nr:hypothetical protein [Hyalangium versicolor]
METTWMAGDRSLPDEHEWDDSLEFIATQLHLPLSVIRFSAEGLAQQLREASSDPTDISAAESLASSAEKMSRMVQALLQASRDGAL